MGTRWNRLAEAVLTSTHNLCFEQKYEKYQNFYLNFFHFSVVKFSVYLYRLVIVMRWPGRKVCPICICTYVFVLSGI